MSIGEKIRFCRNLKGITQGKLAELSGIHPVSIRKYETNRMEPQLAQIEKIANALKINSYAITGTDANMKLETIGDLIGFLMVMYKIGLLLIKGERNKSELLKAGTVSFYINPIVTKFFCQDSDNIANELNNFLFCFKNKKLLDDFLHWERVYYKYQKAKKEYVNNPNDTTKENLDLITEAIETAEIALQNSTVLLSSDEEYTSHIFIENAFNE